MIHKRVNPYIEIAIYSTLAFLLLPIPLLFAVSLVKGLKISEYVLPPDLGDFIGLFMWGFLWLVAGCLFYVWRNRRVRLSGGAVGVLKNVAIVAFVALLWFQLAPLPFVSSISQGAVRDKDGVYQWSYSHSVHWAAFGGAKMTSGAVRYVVHTPESETLEFKKEYRYAGDHYILGLWLIALLLSATTISFGKNFIERL